MKSKEEAASEYGRMVGNGTGSFELAGVAKDSFRAGIEFAENWISVENISNIPIGEWILAKVDDDDYGVYYIKGNYEVDFIKNNYTHFRPINRK